MLTSARLKMNLMLPMRKVSEEILMGQKVIEISYNCVPVHNNVINVLPRVKVDLKTTNLASTQSITYAGSEIVIKENARLSVIN